MDDGLPCIDSRVAAIEVRKQITELLRRGGFHPQKLRTNDPEVLAAIPEEDRFPRFLELTKDKLPTGRALGATWDVQEDIFKFAGLKQEPAFLSQAFSVWDPRGLRLPVLNQKQDHSSESESLKARVG